MPGGCGSCPVALEAQLRIRSCNNTLHPCTTMNADCSCRPPRPSLPPGWSLGDGWDSGCAQGSTEADAGSLRKRLRYGKVSQQRDGAMLPGLSIVATVGRHQGGVAQIERDGVVQ